MSWSSILEDSQLTVAISMTRSGIVYPMRMLPLSPSVNIRMAHGETVRVASIPSVQNPTSSTTTTFEDIMNTHDLDAAGLSRTVKEAVIIDVLINYSREIETDQYGYDYRTCCGGDLEFDHLDDCPAMLAIACARSLFNKE